MAPTIAPPTIVRGTVFDTPFEKACIALAEPDEDGNFRALDSDKVVCEFSLAMVERVAEIISTPNDLSNPQPGGDGIVLVGRPRPEGEGVSALTRDQLEREVALTQGSIESLRGSEPAGGPWASGGDGRESTAYRAWKATWDAEHQRMRDLYAALATIEPVTEERALEVVVQILEGDLANARHMAEHWYSEDTARRVLEVERALELARMALDAWKEGA